MDITDLKEAYMSIVDTIYKSNDENKLIKSIDDFFNKARILNHSVFNYERLIWLPAYVNTSINVNAMVDIEKELNIPKEKGINQYKYV